MPDNDFEKRAKRKLDELRFNPSEEVWLSVQARIKKDKERRRLLIWIPLMGCLLLGIGTWHYFAGNNQALEKNPVSVLHIAKSSLSEDDSLKKNNSTGSGQTVNIPVFASVQKPKLENSPVEKTGTDKMVSTSHTNEPRFSGLPPDVSPADEANKDDHQLAAKTEHPVTAIENDTPSRKKVLPTTVFQPEAVPKQKNKITSKNKLRWGIEGGMGLSAVSSAFRESGQPSYVYYAAPSTGSSGYYNPMLPADKSSLSFYLGLHLVKPLGKTTGIYSGLQYAYASSKISTADAVNQPLTIYNLNYSTVNLSAYYPASASATHNYTNQYHFIEIPLGVEQRLGKNSRFYVEGGFALDWLIATQAMQYDPWTHVYFKDDSYFNRILFNVQGAIQYQVLRKEKYSLKVGPRVQYSLSGLVNEKSGISQQLFSGGISLLLSRN